MSTVCSCFRFSASGDSFGFLLFRLDAMKNEEADIEVLFWTSVVKLAWTGTGTLSGNLAGMLWLTE
jgi:hypothetical protein